LGDPPNTRRFDAGRTEVLTTPASTTTTAPAELRPGGPLERYVAGAEIARGGMGRVMVGTDTRLGREVAIKEALPGGGDLERFEREVRITARLEHPSIVPLYDAGITDAGRPFYVMRKVSGQPLERLIAERTPLEPGAGPPPRPRRAADQRLALLPHVLAAAQALGHAHRRGVVHRDVKPANLLVGELGETVVIDWGLAKVVGEDDAGPPTIAGAVPPGREIATQTGAVFGTPSYMAPEQARGEPLDARSDVYALGATLCHVLTGRPPLPGRITEVLAGARDPGRAAAALAQLAELALPPELTAIVDKAMQFDPARRYPDGAALADDLNRFLAGRLVAAHRYTVADRLARFVRRHRALVAVIAGSALVLATGGALAIRGIVVERERARQAEQAAIAGRRAAEAASEREADRADEAMIVRARSEVALDPTAALAGLATLPPGSRRWADARAIAIEARLRGVVQIYPQGNAPRAFVLGPDPRQLLVAGGVDDRVEIVDMEHRRERTLDPCTGRCIAAWADRGAAVWVGPAAGGLYAVDVATGVRRAPLLAVGPDDLASDRAPVHPDDKIVLLRADPAATLAGVALHDGRAATLDAAGLHYLSGLTGKVDALVISPDGAWAAFASPRELVIVDRGGREIARETGALRTATLTAAASGHQLAILADTGVVLEIDVDIAGRKAAVRHTTPAWRVFFLSYVRDELYINLLGSKLMRPLHALDRRDREVDHLWGSCETWQDHVAVAGDKVELIGPDDRQSLAPPRLHDQFLAIAGRRDARYLAVHVRTAILTWDLADVLPEPVPGRAPFAWLFDDRTTLLSDYRDSEWVDLATGARTPIAMPSGMVLEHHADPATDRALLVITRDGQTPIAVVAHRGRTEVTPVDLPGLREIDLLGAGLIAGTSTGEVIAIDSGSARRVVHRFGAAVDAVAGNAPWIVARDQTGAVVRIDTTTGATDTARPPSATGAVLVTPTGDVYLAADRTVLRWRGRGFEPIAVLPGPIAMIAPIQDGGIVVATPNHELYSLATAPDLPDRSRRATRLYFRSNTGPRLDATGRYLAVSTPFQGGTIFDLTHRTQWQLPSSWIIDSLSPTGRTALLAFGGHVAVAHVDGPEEPAQIHDWIVHATNYAPGVSGP
jgi:hypothetical protein